MKEYSDKEIIECLRNRQSYVVHWLSDRYLPMIRLMVYQMGGNADDARDIFQDGLIIMLEKLDNKEFALTCKFKTFLYCVCEHLWKAVLDKRQSATNYFNRRQEPEGNSDYTDQIDYQLYEKIFREVFETLDPIGKKILTLYWQEMSPQEIAAKLSYTYGYVRKKKSEAQSELTEKVKRHPAYIRIKRTEIAAREVVH
ncbi:MAG TPA: sigma-70 family RNA polymerase sigma factor [Bacteroidales bacterium]|nr:sigma-70 family RNA polymerase sigma factor [Bacteroidales bacterium]